MTALHSTSEQNIYAGISQAFHNKSLLPGFSEAAWGNSFRPHCIPLAKLVEHILAGGSWTPGYFYGNSRRNDTFRFSELIALDLDEGTSVAEALAHPFIAAHAFLVHPTASSSPAKYKTRVVFRLDTLVEHAEAWRALVAALIRELGLQIDPASQKPAQPYHGSTNRVEQPYINPDAVLPISNVTPLLIKPAWEEMERALAPKPERKAVTGERAERYAERAFDDELRKLATAPPGERNTQLYLSAKALYGMALGNWPGIDHARVTSALEQVVTGWEGGHVSRKSASTITSGRNHATARELVLPDKQAQRPSLQPQPITVERVDTPYELQTIGQLTPLMICSRKSVLVALHMQCAGLAANFTAADLAEAADISRDTAQRWIDEALGYAVVSERSAKFTQLESSSNCAKNAERHGAAVARRYCLTLPDALPVIRRRLADHVQHLLEKGDPDVVLQQDALDAGLPEDAAERLELVTDEISQSLDAYEVRAHDERLAVQIARRILARIETDTTRFNPDLLPSSPAELSAAVIAAVIATDPDKTWRHSELMFYAGVKRSSVRALIAKTDLVPAETPTFLDVPIEGQDLHRAVRARCREHHGAPVAWLDANGDVLSSYSADVPARAKGVRLNVGKKYMKRSAAMPQVAAPAPKGPTSEAAPKLVTEEIDTASRAQKRARARTKMALRGNLRARGWHYIGGPYAVWERDGVTVENTWDGMVAALLLDYQWALDQRETRRLQEVEF